MTVIGRLQAVATVRYGATKLLHFFGESKKMIPRWQPVTRDFRRLSRSPFLQSATVRVGRETVGHCTVLERLVRSAQDIKTIWGEAESFKSNLV